MSFLTNNQQSNFDIVLTSTSSREKRWATMIEIAQVFFVNGHSTEDLQYRNGTISKHSRQQQLHSS